MVRLSGAIFAAGAVAAFGQSPSELEQQFAQYVRDFGKSYKDEREREARFRAFAGNVRTIQDTNAKKLGFELGLNEFADMTPDEFAVTHLGIREPAQGRWGDLPYLGRHEFNNVTLPSSVDWRAKGAVLPVKNQAQCGSCWAFSTIGSLEGAWRLASGKLVSMSEQQLVDCSTSFGNQGCSGGLMDNAFKYAQGAAICTEDSYPYEAKNGACRASSCSTAMPQGSVAGYKDVAHNDEQALMAAVAQQPVSVAIEANLPTFQLYKSGVLSGLCGAQLDHGVLIVGYGTDNNQDYWTVRNSWGASWGEQGYVRLLRGKSGSGECGIKSEPSYPVVKQALVNV